MVPLSVGAFATFLLAALLTMPLERVRSGRGPSPAVPAADAGSLTEVAMLAEDPSLDLVADLTEDMDWHTAREVGFAPRQSALDRAVSQLTDVERSELQRLLKEELARGNN